MTFDPTSFAIFPRAYRQAAAICTNPACEFFDCLYVVEEVRVDGEWEIDTPKCPDCGQTGVADA